MICGTGEVHRECARFGAVAEIEQVAGNQGRYGKARRRLAGIAWADAVDQARGTLALACKAEKALLAPDCSISRSGRSLTQFQLEMVRLTNMLDALEGQNLKSVADPG